jgi:hypothetical protein
MRVELHGTEPGEVTRWLRDHTDGDLAFTVSGRSDGGSVYLDIALPISRREIRDIRRDLQRDFPNLRIPDGVKVELKDGDD